MPVLSYGCCTPTTAHTVLRHIVMLQLSSRCLQAGVQCKVQNLLTNVKVTAPEKRTPPYTSGVRRFSNEK